MYRKKLIVAALATILSLGAASPAFADCCDSFWDCAATVVTEGVSCAVQEFIDTVKGLINMVNNLMNIASGAAENAQRAAQQAVTEAIDGMAQQSQSADAELAQAATNAKRLAEEESQIPVYAAQKAGTATNPPAATPRPGAARQATPAAGGSSSHTMTRNSVTATSATSTSHANETATTVSSAAAQGAVSVQAPPRAFMDDMNRGLAEINKAKGIGDGDVTTLNRYMDLARSTEGAGIKSASQIANDAINAPFKGLLSRLTGMLSNPTDLTSPTSIIESMANSIVADLSVNIDKVIGAIVDGPKAALEQAQPTYGDLLTQSARAQAIASAMDQLYHSRTTAAHSALLALLPGAAPSSSGTTMHATTMRSNHIAFGAVMTRFTTSRDKAKSDFLGRFNDFSAKIKQYEGVRAKARAMRGSLPAVRSNFSSQLDARLNGKTQAERTAQRDSLVKEARAHFAKDPKTRDAVIGLLTSESNKRIAMIRH